MDFIVVERFLHSFEMNNSEVLLDYSVALSDFIFFFWTLTWYWTHFQPIPFILGRIRIFLLWIRRQGIFYQKTRTKNKHGNFNVCNQYKLQKQTIMLSQKVRRCNLIIMSGYYSCTKSIIIKITHHQLSDVAYLSSLFEDNESRGWQEGDI